MARSLAFRSFTRNLQRCANTPKLKTGVGVQTQQRQCFGLRRFSTSGLRSEATKMTPATASKILRRDEFTSGELYGEGESPVRFFETNTLASNNPIEDSHAEAILNFQTNINDPPGLVFGIYDGHGGASCGIVTANRLHHYVAAALLNLEDLKIHLDKLKAAGDDVDLVHAEMNRIVTNFNQSELVHDLKRAYQKSYYDFVCEMFRERVGAVEEDENNSGLSVAERISEAFIGLDNDMSKEATEKSANEELALMTSTVALSGAVAVFAYVSGPMLHIASCGDCVAVLGSLSENETWIAKKLTVDHNTENETEVNRILNEHPGEQRMNIFRGDRLLGMLAPLRAFGDFRFKWNAKVIQDTIGNLLGHQAVPGYYKSPPYLTVEPDVISHKLSPKDRFLVIGSDGLWDMMTPMQVIRLIGEHISGKVTLSPLVLNPNTDIHFGELKNALKKRQAAMKLKPQDLNSATHLIRSALGGSAYGVDHGRLSQMLTLPPDMVRMFRDDITVTVIFFDQEFLRHS